MVLLLIDPPAALPAVIAAALPVTEAVTVTTVAEESVPAVMAAVAVVPARIAAVRAMVAVAGVMVPRRCVSEPQGHVGTVMMCCTGTVMTVA